MAKAKIKHKHASFTGQIGPVAFTKGEGETDIATAVRYFKRHPELFEVSEPKPRKSEAEKQAEREAAEKAAAEKAAAEKAAAKQDGDKGGKPGDDKE